MRLCGLGQVLRGSIRTTLSRRHEHASTCPLHLLARVETMPYHTMPYNTIAYDTQGVRINVYTPDKPITVRLHVFHSYIHFLRLQSHFQITGSDNTVPILKLKLHICSKPGLTQGAMCLDGLHPSPS